MKRTITAACLLAALFAAMLAGCGEKQSAPTPAPAPAAQTSGQGGGASAAPAAPAAPEPSAMPDPEAEKVYQAALLAYEPVMDQNCRLIYNGLSEEEDYSYVSGGVMELAMYQKRAELLKTVGYTYDDINDDGIPELLIGTIPDKSAAVPEKQMIFAGYTCKDGEVCCFLDGMARDSYRWMDYGRFYNFGSGGAAYSGFGTFHISPDGTELQCEDWYFSDTRGPDNAEIFYCHNTTGVWDSAQAEELDIDSDAFWAISDKYDAECSTLNLMPITAYSYTGFINQPLDCKVRVDYLEDAAYQYSYYDDASEYMDAAAEYETTILFQSDEGAADFKLLALTLKDVDADGHADFDIEEVFQIPSLRAGIPLAVPMSFPGDIPSNGFSYTDKDGTTKAYTVSMSGYDGSLVVAPLE